MIREIKFRVWIPSYKEMFIVSNTGVQKFDCENGFSLMFAVDGYTEIWAHENYGVVKDAIIMQYTGLKDKNGVEIYEGDILRSFHFQDHKGTYYLYHKVIWDIDYTGWKAVSIDNPEGESIVAHGNPQLWVYLKHAYNSHEVIGNIYETPELLTNNKTH